MNATSNPSWSMAYLIDKLWTVNEYSPAQRVLENSKFFTVKVILRLLALNFD
jgi:hypothetical protein